MVFQWKIPLKVSAAAAANELERIFKKYGEIAPETVVEESRAEESVLHDLFEWDDAKAAEKYRVTQARFIIRNIVNEEGTEDGPILVRSYHNMEQAYAPTTVIMSDRDMRERLLEQALAEMESFRAKYHHLKALADVFIAMDEALKTV